MKPIISRNLTPLPYVSAACRRLGMGVSKPLPASGRDLERGLFIH